MAVNKLNCRVSRVVVAVSYCQLAQDSCFGCEYLLEQIFVNGPQKHHSCLSLLDD